MLINKICFFFLCCCLLLAFLYAFHLLAAVIADVARSFSGVEFWRVLFKHGGWVSFFFFCFFFFGAFGVSLCRGAHSGWVCDEYFSTDIVYEINGDKGLFRRQFGCMLACDGIDACLLVVCFCLCVCVCWLYLFTILFSFSSVCMAHFSFQFVCEAKKKVPYVQCIRERHRIHVFMGWRCLLLPIRIRTVFLLYSFVVVSTRHLNRS